MHIVTSPSTYRAITKKTRSRGKNTFADGENGRNKGSCAKKD